VVPFEALLAVDPPDEEGGKLAKNAYLVERFDVSYTPSATALAAIQGHSGGGGIVALGDPLFHAQGQPAGGLEPLPNTAAELAVIQQLARSRDIEVLVGAQASRSRLLSSMALADAQIIHIATHGTADEHDPSRSGLWLAAEDGDGPGFLSVPDILGLDLRASMVALSACETGLGRIERGEGVLGLSRSFMASGANSVLVSLWKVNDASTALLMRDFYEGLLKKKRERARSLADAKRRLLKKKETRSPFHWAAFILVGADGALQ
jgi:CHAT domain-containing protein